MSELPTTALFSAEVADQGVHHGQTGNLRAVQILIGHTNLVIIFRPVRGFVVDVEW